MKSGSWNVHKSSTDAGEGSTILNVRQSLGGCTSCTCRDYMRG
jgi:hypothetical protein